MQFKKRYVLAIVLIFFVLLYFASYVPYDQLMSEKYALSNCYSAVADKRLSSIEDCSTYTRFHIDLYPEYVSRDPVESACFSGKGVLDYLKRTYPLQLERRERARKVVDKYCNFSFHSER